MSEAADDRPISYVKLLREIRDRLAEETADMTTDEYLRWCNSGEYEAPGLAEIAARAKPTEVYAHRAPKPRSRMRAELRPYLKYKSSGVEWLGEVPEHWRIRPIKAAFVIQLGKMLQTRRTRPDDIRVPYLKALHVQWHQVMAIDPPNMWASIRDIRAYGIAGGDLLVCEGGEVGRSAMVTMSIAHNCIIQNSLHRVRPRIGSSNKFLQYVMEAMATLGWINALCDKATIGHLTTERLGGLRIPMPPETEQKQACIYLDRETAKIDALIGKKEALVKRLKEYRTALVSRTVTRGLPPDEARKAGLVPHPKLKPSGVEWLGEVPEHWDVRRLKSLASRQIESGIDSLSHVYNPKWPRYVRITDIAGPRLLHGGASMRSLPPDIATKALLRHGDLLLARSGTTGASYLHADDGKEQACFAGYLVRFSADTSKVLPEFVSYYTESTTYLSLLRSRVVQSTIENFSAGKYRRLEVPIPPLTEQECIVAYLDQETFKIDKVTEFARQEVNLLYEYRTRLISDVVTGKVDVRGFLGANVKAVA